jgi:hypothetical protein
MEDGVINKIIIIAALTMVLITGFVHAAPVDPPLTAPTISGASGNEVVALNERVRPSGPRFTNPDGTAPITGKVIMDQLTGLMWLRDANCIKTNYASFDNDGTKGDGAVTWRHVLAFVAGINAGKYPDCGDGRTDWRIPNRKELTSLINDGQAKYASWLNDPAQGFRNVQADRYWETDAYPYAALMVLGGLPMYDSGMNMEDMSYYYFHVWPVRSGK